MKSTRVTTWDHDHDRKHDYWHLHRADRTAPRITLPSASSWGERGRAHSHVEDQAAAQQVVGDVYRRFEIVNLVADWVTVVDGGVLARVVWRSSIL